MNTGKAVIGIMAGVAAGAAAGALLGILYAPDKGINTRKRIVERKDEISEDIKDRFDRVSDFISEKFNGAKRDARDLAERGKSKVNEIRREAKSASS